MCLKTPIDINDPTSPAAVTVEGGGQVPSGIYSDTPTNVGEPNGEEYTIIVNPNTPSELMTIVVTVENVEEIRVYIGDEQVGNVSSHIHVCLFKFHFISVVKKMILIKLNHGTV